MSIIYTYVHKQPSGGKNYYYLVEVHEENGNSKSNYLYSYGLKPPTFYEPVLFNDFCENKLTELEANSVDLIIDDPPYGITNQDWDKEPDWEKLVRLYRKVLSDTGTIFVFGRQPSLINVYNVFDANGFEFRFEVIWKKQNAPWLSSYMPISIHENIFAFCKKGAKANSLTFNLQEIMKDGIFVCPECGKKLERKSYKIVRNHGGSNAHNQYKKGYKSFNTQKRYPTSVVEYRKVGGSHDEYLGFPSQKPEALLRWIIIAASNEGDIVLDPHVGTGSTLSAAIPLCRRSIGIEIDKARFQMSLERISKKVEKLKGLKHAKVLRA